MRTQRDKERAEALQEQKIIQQEEARIEEEGLRGSVAASIAALEGAAGRKPFKLNLGLNEESFISGLQVPEAPEVSLGSSMKIGGPLYQDPEIDKPKTTFKRTMSGFKPVREKPTTPIDQVNIGPLIPNVSANIEDDQTARDDLQKKLFMKDNEDAIREQMMKEGVYSAGTFSTDATKIKTAEDGTEIEFSGLAPVKQFVDNVGLETEDAFRAFAPSELVKNYEDRQRYEELKREAEEANAAGIRAGVVVDKKDGITDFSTARIVYPRFGKRGLPQTDSERGVGTGVVQGGLLEGENVDSNIGKLLRIRANDVSLSATREKTNTVAAKILELFTAAGINPDVDFTTADNIAILNAADDMGSISESKREKGNAAINLIISNKVAELQSIKDQTDRFTAQTGLATAQMEAYGASIPKRIMEGTFDANDPQYLNFIRSQEWAETFARSLDKSEDLSDAIKIGNAYIDGALKVIKQNDARLDELSIDDPDDEAEINRLQEQNKTLYEMITKQLNNFSSRSKIVGSEQAAKDLLSKFNAQYTPPKNPEITKPIKDDDDDNDNDNEEVVDEEVVVDEVNIEKVYLDKYQLTDTTGMSTVEARGIEKTNKKNQEILNLIENIDWNKTVEKINSKVKNKRDRTNLFNTIRQGNITTALKRYLVKKK